MLAKYASIFRFNTIIHQDILLENETHAFIIRVWSEAQDREGNILTWRGSIDHVGGSKRLYFQDLDGAVRFIQEQTGISKKQKTSNWKSLMMWVQNEIAKRQLRNRI
jgi:hypothetical protein